MSRALHLVTFKGHDMSRFRDHHKQMLIYNALMHKELGGPDARDPWVVPISSPFTRGIAHLSPTKNQERYGLSQATNLLQTGRNLLEVL